MFPEVDENGLFFLSFFSFFNRFRTDTDDKGIHSEQKCSNENGGGQGALSSPKRLSGEKNSNKGKEHNISGI